MPARISLPPTLAREPFLVSSGREAGVGENRMRGADLDSTVWGVRAIRMPPAPPREELLRRCRMFALRMPPGAFFSHSTAALLLGAPLPFRLERATEPHLAVAAPSRAPHAQGLHGHRLAITEGDLLEFQGLLLTSPSRTWCDLASQLTLRDLVAVGDFLIHWRQPLTTLDELIDTAQRFVGLRGMTLLRKALPLLSDRAESRPESQLRVILLLAGLPAPRVNHTLVIAETGRNVRIDLHFDEHNVHLEYQGDYHRTREQWRKDMTRRSRLEAQGGYVMELNADDLREEKDLVSRIRTVLLSRGWRP